MATDAEYEAVHGTPVPAGKTSATEFGDGGCFAIFKGKYKSEVIGRWRRYADAEEALTKLQLLNGRFEYLLEPSHHWVGGLSGNTKCSNCGLTRAPAPRTTYPQIEWPS
jgi:hypothetical protein